MKLQTIPILMALTEHILLQIGLNINSENGFTWADIFENFSES